MFFERRLAADMAISCKLGIWARAEYPARQNACPIDSSCWIDISSESMTDPQFDLRQLRQFAVLAEECHFGRAAARLAMTQPPLTQAIQRLEAALGTPRFQRSQRRAALTPAGAALLPLARKLLEAADALAPAVRAAAAGLSG